MSLTVRQFAGTAGQVSAARSFASEVLAGDPRARDVAAALSEVATNAVTHSRTGCGGTFRVAIAPQPDVIRVEVTDNGGGGIPQVQRVNGTETHGRGLKILTALTIAWGHTLRRDSLTVWFDVARPDRVPY